jgi:hypothetical protein
MHTVCKISEGTYEVAFYTTGIYRPIRRYKSEETAMRLVNFLNGGAVVDALWIINNGKPAWSQEGNNG